MRKHIEKLRQKPYHIRKALFYLATGVSMALVVGIWVHSLGNRWNENLQAEKIQNDFKPFSLFSKSVSDTYVSTKEAMGGFSAGLGATVGGVFPEEESGAIQNTETVPASEPVPEI